MSEQDGKNNLSEVLLFCLNSLYGNRFRQEMQNDLKSAMDTVIKTLSALKSVALNSYQNSFLPFTPFRKDD
jgi:hypothetical protein